MSFIEILTPSFTPIKGLNSFGQPKKGMECMYSKAEISMMQVMSLFELAILQLVSVNPLLFTNPRLHLVSNDNLNFL